MILFYKSLHIVALIFLWANVAYSVVRVRSSLKGGPGAAAPSRFHREDAAAGGEHGDESAEPPGDVFAELARSDLWFTGGAWAVIIVSGWLLMGVVNIGWLDAGWLTVSIVLTTAGVLIWLGVVMPLQRRLGHLLGGGREAGLPAASRQLIGRWYGAVILSLVIMPAVVLYLMSAKPGL